MIKIALVGCDTSHSVAFTKILNDEKDPLHISDAKVIAAIPGGFGSIENSQEKALRNSREIALKYGVNIFDEIKDLPRECDAIFIESTDGAQHLEQISEAAEFNVPIFIDKPMALNELDVYKIYEIGRNRKIQIMSCSALRFAEAFEKAKAACEGKRVLGADIFGPISFVKGCPGFFWYGIHSAEMLFAAMGAGLHEVKVIRENEFDVLIGIWNDGRIGTIRGMRTPHFTFGGTLHTATDSVAFHVPEDGALFYVRLLKNIMTFVKTGISPIYDGETLDIIRFLLLANQSVQS